LFLRDNFQEFKINLKTRGVIYVFWKGIKYTLFVLKILLDKLKPKSPQIPLMKDGIEIVYFRNSINILYNGCEITKGAGLNIAINTLGIWTASTKADWQILEEQKKYLKVKIIFRELPISQIWIIKVENEEQISWHVTMHVEEWLHIDEIRAVCFVNSAYRSWIADYQQADFPRSRGHWQNLFMNAQPVSIIGVRFPIESQSFLPLLALETQNESFLPIVQSPPSDNNANLIGLRMANEKNYFEESYNLFSIKINLFKEESLIDAKIESRRKEHLIALQKENISQKKNKKLNFLLANLPWQREGKWGVRAGSRWPHINDSSEGSYLPFPFFLAYATSLLQKHNINALMIDAIAEKNTADEFLKRILSMDFEYLVAETSIPSFYDDMALLKKISLAGVKIILCGPNAEIYQPHFLKENTFISFILFGEYEFSLLDLAQTLIEGKDLSKVNGLIYDNNGVIVKNHHREPFDINLLPWPYRGESLPMNLYLDAPGEMLTPSVQILASRGCPFKCKFCLWPQVLYQGHHYRARDVKDVVDEMEYLALEKGFKSFYFDDDTFNVGKERMLSFCREIKKRGLNEFQWAIMARPDLMDEEILVNMKEAGLWAIKYGVESATQSLLDSIGKSMDLIRSERMIRLSKRLGIKVHLTFTFGLPGETEDTIKQTIKYAKELDPFSLQFSILTPFPGTSYYNYLEREGSIVSKDFSSYDGHSKSVIKLKDLAPEDLEAAKEKACRMWADHLRKRRGFLGDIERFYYYTKNKNLSYSLKKTIGYFKYVIFERKKYLNIKNSPL